MRKTLVCLAVAFCAQIGSSSAQTCLHGRSEPAEERARREHALKIAHQINIAEAFAKQSGGKYRPLSELVNVPAPPSGFAVRLLTDGAAYTLSMKDERDACRYAIFSDQDGRIYEGYPGSRPVVLPVQTQ